MKKWQIKEEVVKAAEESETIADMLRALDMRVNNGNYRRLKYIAESFGTSVPTGGRTVGARMTSDRNKLAAEEYFSLNSSRSGSNIKARLLKEQGWEDKCSICEQLPFWYGKPLTLQVDHINGDRFDNRLENLRILCPHCHSQTDTYSNKGSEEQRKERRYSYCDCGRRMSKAAMRCIQCSNTDPALAYSRGHNKFDWPPVDECVDLVKQLGYLKAAKKIGTSDNGLRKYLTRNDIDIKQLRKVRS